MMILYESLAMSSLRGGNIGITGIALIVLYFIGMFVALRLIGRHEYYPEGFEIYLISMASFVSSTIGFYIGYGSSGQGASILAYALIFCGVASFLTSWKFLDYRLIHRIIIGITSPTILVLSVLGAEAINQFIIKLVF